MPAGCRGGRWEGWEGWLEYTAARRGTWGGGTAGSQRRRGTATNAKCTAVDVAGLGRSETGQPVQGDKYRAGASQLWVAGYQLRTSTGAGTGASGGTGPERRVLAGDKVPEQTGGADGQADRDPQQGSFRVEGVNRFARRLSLGCFGGEGLAGDGLCCDGYGIWRGSEQGRRRKNRLIAVEEERGLTQSNQMESRTLQSRQFDQDGAVSKGSQDSRV
ncbi:hypothetical protein V8C35DRAFT_84969 [Trichoderma chlorosporum]